MGRAKWKGFRDGRGAPAKPPEHMIRYLAQLSYPARTNFLIEQARAKDAPTDVLHILKRLPDKEFLSPREVMHAVEAME